MIDLKFDMAAFSVATRDVAAVASQMPFALSRTLNVAADATRGTIITDLWPKSVQVRSRSFIGAALTTKGERASKANLRVTIYDKLGRAALSLHDKGGAKSAKGRFAVPNQPVQARRGAKGVPKNLRPGALPNSFRKGDAIYQRVRGKKSKRLRLMYVLKRSTPVQADVPFTSTFERSMRFEIAKTFPVEMAKALASRRK